MCTCTSFLNSQRLGVIHEILYKSYRAIIHTTRESPTISRSIVSALCFFERYKHKHRLSQMDGRYYFPSFHPPGSSSETFLSRLPKDRNIIEMQYFRFDPIQAGSLGPMSVYIKTTLRRPRWKSINVWTSTV